jgi:hypothetical protein
VSGWARAHGWLDELFVGTTASPEKYNPPRLNINPDAAAQTPPGIRALWESDEWRRLVASDDLKSSPLMAAPALAPADMAAPGSGAKRGLLDAVLALSVPASVLGDLESHLPAVPEDQEEARALTYEFYSAQRVQLATLPRGVLERVASVARGCEAGSSMWDVLEPLRGVRPVNGGPGWDEEAVMGLRALDLYISAGGGDEDDEAMEDAMNNAAGAA